MKPEDQDRAAVRIPPPLVFVAVAFAGLLLDKFVLALPLGLPDGLRIAAVWGAVLFAAGFMATAAALFFRTGQDPTPWKSTPEVVSKGPYRLTRNPMYLGMALLQAAAGLWQSSGWVIGLLPLSLLGCYLVAIRHEEAYLQRKFGDTYSSYKSSVRRWL